MNIYIQYLSHSIIPHNKHYLDRLIKMLKHYKSIEPKTRPKDKSHEDHHIVPSSWLKRMNIKDDSRNTNPDNKVFLPLRVHFIVHYLYYKSFPIDIEMGLAFAGMNRLDITSKIYQATFNIINDQRSNRMKSIKKSQEWCQNISIGKKGIVIAKHKETNEVKVITKEEFYSHNNFVGINKGRQHTQKEKDRASLQWKGIPKSEEHKQNLRKPKRKYQCPVCGIMVGHHKLIKYHSDNCVFLSH